MATVVARTRCLDSARLCLHSHSRHRHPQSDRQLVAIPWLVAGRIVANVCVAENECLAESEWRLAVVHESRGFILDIVGVDRNPVAIGRNPAGVWPKVSADNVENKNGERGAGMGPSRMSHTPSVVQRNKIYIHTETE